MDETRTKTTKGGHHASKKSLESLVGRNIKLKLGSDELVEGAIYTYDKITNCVALDCSQGAAVTRRVGSFRIINISFIKEILSVSTEKKQLNEPTYLPVERLKVREKEAIERMENKISKMGVGVTQEAQDIFNGLSKT
jgi:small nuclear ribonucleoprotein (snRNP)-like protein